MKYKIESQDNEVNVEVSETKGAQEKLLAAFQECQEGRCSCPTDEYAKLGSLEIESGEGSVHLKLKSKPGEQLDEAEISKCLDYTTSKLTDEG